MSHAYARRPSAGFVLAVALIAASASLLVWGGRTPPLQAAWQMQLALASGERVRLDDAAREQLQDTLSQHPAWALKMSEEAPSGLLSQHDDGRVDARFAYLLRASAAQPGRLEVAYRGRSATGSVEVIVRTSGFRFEGTSSPDGSAVTDLPEDGPFPQLVEIELTDRGRGGPKKKRRHGVHVTLVEAP